nr:immunoglobulin light chain junction region [Macaca mulatta]MPO04845.1 immunoglobulin light chain junction region [Macaca mulatta]
CSAWDNSLSSHLF